MPGNGNGLFPGRDQGTDALHHNGFPEHRPVQDGPDGTVGTGPHFLQSVFLHPGRVGRNGGTFHRHPVFFGGQGRIDSHLVVRIVPMLHAQVVIFRFQVHIRNDQDIFDHLPKDPGHFIPIHFHQRGRHFDFIRHATLSLLKQRQQYILYLSYHRYKKGKNTKKAEAAIG